MSDDSFQDETYIPPSNNDDDSDSDGDEYRGVANVAICNTPLKTTDASKNALNYSGNGSEDIRNVGVLKTPSKALELEMYIKISRSLGCSTPLKDNVRDDDTKFHLNFSALFHCFYLKNDMKFEEKPISLEIMEKIMDFGGQDCLNLIKGECDASDMYFDVLRNGRKSESKWAGNKNSGFLDFDGFHRSDLEFCPFRHCEIVKEKMNSILGSQRQKLHMQTPKASQNPKSGEILVSPVTPTTPVSMKVMLKDTRMVNRNLKTANKNLERALELETERSIIYLDKLQNKDDPENRMVKRFPCPLCESTFTRIDSVTRHLKKAHPEAEGNAKQKDDVVRCKMCSKTMASRSLVHHLTICKVLSTSKPTKNVDARSGFCTACNIPQANLLRHTENVHSEKCRLCPKQGSLKCPGCLKVMCNSCITLHGFCLKCTIIPGVDKSMLKVSRAQRVPCTSCSAIETECTSCCSLFCRNCQEGCKCGCNVSLDWCNNCMIVSTPQNILTFPMAEKILKLSTFATRKLNFPLEESMLVINDDYESMEFGPSSDTASAFKKPDLPLKKIFDNKDGKGSPIREGISGTLGETSVDIPTSQNNSAAILSKNKDNLEKISISIICRSQETSYQPDTMANKSITVNSQTPELSTVNIDQEHSALEESGVNLELYEGFQLSEDDKQLLSQLLHRIRVIENDFKEHQNTSGVDEEYVERLMTDFGNRNDLTKKDRKSLKTTISSYIRILNRDGFPWLRKR